MKKLIRTVATVALLSSAVAQAKPFLNDGWPQPAGHKICKKCLNQVHIKVIKATSDIKTHRSGKITKSIRFKGELSQELRKPKQHNPA